MSPRIVNYPPLPVSFSCFVKKNVTQNLSSVVHCNASYSCAAWLRSFETILTIDAFETTSALNQTYYRYLTKVIPLLLIYDVSASILCVIDVIEIVLPIL